MGSATTSYTCFPSIGFSMDSSSIRHANSGVELSLRFPVLISCIYRPARKVCFVSQRDIFVILDLFENTLWHQSRSRQDGAFPRLCFHT
ncbi:hypothetical protein BS47DRAFT_827248 [Hydnum rufescens UP504]|uniref:Uncharacterized protein n=1 Tax=Hydnum rufescens UP504 TaxID=1448309 RepID=A0A9P6DXP1_9AGAM|nr:hypothetical protein BS47DRAFT_827248 [Hydnum rufescens UP504]